MPGVSLGITLPNVGETEGPDYATLVRAALETMIDDLEAKIVPSEILINEDLPFRNSGTSYSATGMKRVAFFPEGSVLGGGNTNSIYSVGGELYFQDGSGNDVAMTSNGNVAGAAGNISTSGSPAYASSGVELLWVGGDLEYRLKSGAAATAFADLVCAQVDLRNGSLSTTLARAGGGSSYTLTLPNAGPSANDLATLDASGVVTFGKTLGGDYIVSGDLGVGGELSVSGDIKHGDRTLTLSPASADARDTSGSNQVYLSANGDFWQSQSTSQKLHFPIPLHVGDRIKSIRYVIDKATTGTAGITLYKQDISASPPVESPHESWSTSTSGVNDTTETLSSAYTIGGDDVVWLMVDMVATSDEIYGVQVVYDRP